MTPDPYQANNGGPGDPRVSASWNRFAYVIGDPVNLFDPQGTTYCFVDPNTGLTVYCYDSADVTASLGDVQGGSGGGGGDPNTPSLEAPPDVGSPAISELDPTACLNSFSNSTLGGVVKFFSLIDLLDNLKVPGIVAEWTVLPALKAEVVAVLKSLSSTVGGADFLPVAGLAESVTIAAEFAALEAAASNPILLTTVPFATAIDAGVHQMCSQVPGLRF